MNKLTLDETYDLLELLGTGSFGKVYKAKHLRLDRIVSVKILNTILASDEEIYGRFEREAVTLCALKHRNIVQFYGYGRTEGAPYLVMEYTSGKTLFDQLLAGKLPPEETLRLMHQLCAGLHCAHSNGIVHRDLKPANVMLEFNDVEPTVKIIDFGLAKVLPGFGKEMQQLTDAVTVVGSVGYMSPEQCVGAAVDGRTDIYSVGCMLFECLTGEAPYTAENYHLIMHKQVSASLPMLPEYVSTDKPLLTALNDVIHKCIAKEPENRYQTVLELQDDIQQLLAGKTQHLAAGGTAGSDKGTVQVFGMSSSRTNLIVSCLVAACTLSVISAFTVDRIRQAHPHPNSAVSDARDNSPKYFLEVENASKGNVTVEQWKKVKQLAETAWNKNKSDNLLGPARLASLKFQLARLYIMQDQPAKADEFFNDACTDYLEGHFALDYKVYVALSARANYADMHPGRLKNLKIVENWFDQRPAPPHLLANELLLRCQLANIFTHAGQPEVAIRFLSKYNQEARPILLENGIALFHLGRYKDAESMFEKVLEPGDRWSDPEAFSTYLRTLMAQNKWQELETLEKMVDKNHTGDWNESGRQLVIQAHKKNWAAADAIYKDVIASTQDEPQHGIRFKAESDLRQYASILKESGFNEKARIVNAQATAARQDAITYSR